jgi:integrase
VVTKSTPTISEAAQQYVTVREAWTKPKTMASVRSNVLRFAAAMGEKQIGRLTAYEVEAYFAQTSQRVTPGTYNMMRGRIGQFLQFCQGRGWISRDLMQNVRPRQVQNREHRRLDAMELLQLLDCAAHPRDRALMALAMNTGCRVSELLSIRLKHLDLDKQEVELTIAKTGGSDMMPLTGDVIPELVRWLEFYEGRAGKMQGDWLLFPAKGGRKYTGRVGQDRFHMASEDEELFTDRQIGGAERIVTRALARFGWTDTHGEGFHTIRRSVGRIYFDAASDRGHDSALRETSALLHHSNSATTERYLGITAEKRKRDQVMRGQGFLSTAAKAAQAKLEVVEDGPSGAGAAGV